MEDKEHDDLDQDLPRAVAPVSQVPATPAPTTIHDDGTIMTAGDLKLPSHWGFDQAALENVRRGRALVNLRHGLLSSVPMICKSAKCPFVESCWVPANERRIGMRCPIEVSAVIERFERYCKALLVNPEEDIVDAQMVKDLVDLEIQVIRAENKLAQAGGEFIDMVVAAVDPNGQAHFKPELSKAAEYKLMLRREHGKILEQLSATRKDRERAQQAALGDEATRAAALMQKFREMQAAGQAQVRHVIEVVQEAKEVNEDGQKDDPAGA